MTEVIEKFSHHSTISTNFYDSFNKIVDHTYVTFTSFGPKGQTYLCDFYYRSIYPTNIAMHVLDTWWFVEL